MKESYISVVNNSEFYKINKILTEKDSFSQQEETGSALARISDDKKMVSIEITEYDIVKNPSLIMRATSKEEIVSKVTERLINLDQTTRDTYLILFTHWMNHKTKGFDFENEIESESAYIELNNIHFGYRGLTGKNKESTMQKEQYNGYVKAIDVLANTKIKIDITKESNAAYDKIKNLGWGSIEGFLIDKVRWVYSDLEAEKIIGIQYELGLIGDAYTKYVPQINNKYPSALLRLDSKQSVVKNIGNYLCYLHRCNKGSKNLTTLLNFYNLMGESRFEIKPPRYQQYINIFIKHIEKAKKILIENKIITNIDIPQDIQFKNYKEKNITINWRYID